MLHSNIIKTINFLVLFASVLLVLFLPYKKEIWYDETISMMCSKGVNPGGPTVFSNPDRCSSEQLQQVNTVSNVFAATVVDNSNSFLYNVSLHWFTSVFGNALSTYVLLSRIIGALTLLVVFILSVSLLGNSLFVSLVSILLYTDIDFVGMSHEVRAYIMGMMLSSLAGISFFRYINNGSKPFSLFITALVSVAAVLTHFLSVYVVLVFVLSLLVIYKKQFFTLRNIIAISLPVLLIVIFFYFSMTGLEIMSIQNAKIKSLSVIHGFSYVKVLIGTLKFFSLNFKFVLPAFINKSIVIMLSAASVLGVYYLAIRKAVNATVRRNLHLLFILGSSSSIFLAFLCFKSQHYTALYYRYHSFSIPFSTLFVVYALWVITKGISNKRIIPVGLVSVFLFPCILYYVVAIRSRNPKMSYNHLKVAEEIVNNNITEIEVPEWADIYLIHSAMPAGYKVDYVRNNLSVDFTLRNAGGSFQIQKLAKDN